MGEYMGRGENALFYGGTMGVNFALVTGSFSGCYEMLAWQRQKRDIYNAIGAGAITGAAWSTFYAGPSKSIHGALLFTTIGAFGYISEEKYLKWKDDKALRLYEEKFGTVSHHEDMAQPSGRVFEAAQNPQSEFERETAR